MVVRSHFTVVDVDHRLNLVVMVLNRLVVVVDCLTLAIGLLLQVAPELSRGHASSHGASLSLPVVPAR